MSATVPHQVVIAERAIGRHYWAINRDIEQEGRHVVWNSSVGHYAVIRLRLEIDFGDAAVLFVNAVDERDVEPWARDRWGAYVQGVVEGVRESLPSLSPDGLPVQALKVTLTGMKTHQIDSGVRDFTLAAMDAMTAAVRTVGLSPGPT